MNTPGSSHFYFRQLVRLIIANRTAVGERLPVQEDLRRRFGVSHQTLSAAMEHLVAAGIVTRKTRVGTVLADRQPLLALRWHIGILTFSAPGFGPNTFYAYLHHALTVRLAALGWAAASYIRCSTPHWPHHLLADFPGLETDLDEERIDGFVALTPISRAEWQRLAAQGVVGCRLDTWSSGARGVFIDLPRFEKAALGALAVAGCKRLGRTNMLTDCAFDNVKVFDFQPGPDSGRALARQLLSLPPQETPDGMVIPDDHAAAAVLSLFLSAGRKPPQVAVLTNRQLPIHFERPVLAFEIDIDELADRAVTVLQNRIVRKEVDGAELVAARRI